MFDFIASLYAPFYALSVLALVGWIYFQDHNQSSLSQNFRRLFSLAFGTYLLSTFVADAQFGFKLGVLFRDLLVIGSLGFLFKALLHKREVFIIGSILMAAGFLWFYYAKVKTTFIEKVSVIKGLNLDKNGELLIEIKEKATLGKLQKTLQKYNLRAERAFYPEKADATNLDNYYVVNIPDKFEGDIKKIEQALYKSGVVAWVEENEIVNVAPIASTKPAPINNKFGINDPGLDQLWGFEAMNIDKLYNYLNTNKIKPKRKALVAILDTGVDGKHEDLKGNFKSTKSQYDNDPVGHGTHCAGIAGAVSNNGIGVASFSTDNSYIQLTSIKVLNSYGSGTQQSIIKGIIEAADKGADVLSMSLGGLSDRFKIKAYEDAVKYVEKAGGIVVAAAGNSNRNAKDYSPVNTPGVIGVSAIDQDLNRAVFSNTVNDIKMGVAAPGVAIYSSIPDNKYNTYNGTSMATPYVAGLVGLLKSLNPKLTAKEAYDILNKTGKNTKATNLTGKLIQPADAVKNMIGG
ncbi:MAG: S8 family serine peptidase [Saprospiraceae bacterium]|nr:S8 family serine peptidase [Saprospiraceae bacterium]